MPSSRVARFPTVSPETILIWAVDQALQAPSTRPFVLGLCGAQGSGKSTLAAAIAAHVPRTAVLSLDDLYRTHAERAALAAEIHPLLATRGVPGTHDVDLGLATFAALDEGAPVRLPRFDKAADERIDARLWPTSPERPALIVFEGWCVGARPQTAEALVEPINATERDHDPFGQWRRYVNASLAGAYQRLFARIDHLVLLRAPSWDRVFDWRLQQEHVLRRTGSEGVGVMTDDAVRTFVSHYERLTRHILQTMPDYAHLTLQLDAARTCVGVQRLAVTPEKPG